MISTTTVLASVALALACLVSSSYGQAATATSINCYQCSGSYYATNGNPGCGYPFNATGQSQSVCYGQCTKTIIFDAFLDYATSPNGASDTYVRGCSQTTPAVGCSSPSSAPGTTVCVSVCSTNLCNSANSLLTRQSTAVRLLAAVGLLIAVVNFRRQ